MHFQTISTVAFLATAVVAAPALEVRQILCGPPYGNWCKDRREPVVAAPVVAAPAIEVRQILCGPPYGNWCKDRREAAVAAPVTAATDTV